MIEDIERFRAELQVHALGQVELLLHREVEIGQWRADCGILRQISESTGGWQHQGAGIKPQVWRAQPLPGLNAIGVRVAGVGVGDVWTRKSVGGESAAGRGSASVDLRAWNQARTVCRRCTLTEAATAAAQAIRSNVSAWDVEGNSSPQSHDQIRLPA